MRHRRPAQRRQVDALQRADQGRHRGRELPVLHDRAERRHRRSARRRGCRRWPRSPSPRRSCRRSSSSSTSPASSPARRRAKASATSSSRTSARPTRSSTSCAASRTTNVIHVAGKVDPVADIEMIETELCLADLRPSRRACTATPRPRSPATTRKRGKLVDVLEKCQARARPGAAGALASTSARKNGAAASRYVPDHRQAGDVRRERRRRRLREQSASRPAARRCAEAQSAPVVAICAAIEAEIADMDDADRQLFLAEMGQTSRA